MNKYSNFRQHEIGLTKKTMSKMIGISVMTINRFEQDAAFGGVSPEMVEKLQLKYADIGRYFSKQNRESYMTYIRSYLDQSHIGLVEFSRMCKTATDIYRRPNKKSYILATAEQIMHIQDATSIKYDDVLGLGDGRRKKSSNLEPIIPNEHEELKPFTPDELEPVPTEEALQMAEQIRDDIPTKEDVTLGAVLKYVRNHATAVNGLATGLSYHIVVNPDQSVSYYRESDEITVEHHKKELTAEEFRKATKYIEYEGGKR